MPDIPVELPVTGLTKPRFGTMALLIMILVLAMATGILGNLLEIAAWLVAVATGAVLLLGLLAWGYVKSWRSS